MRRRPKKQQLLWPSWNGTKANKSPIPRLSQIKTNLRHQTSRQESHLLARVPPMMWQSDPTYHLVSNKTSTLHRSLKSTYSDRALKLQRSNQIRPKKTKSNRSRPTRKRHLTLTPRCSNQSSSRCVKLTFLILSSTALTSKRCNSSYYSSYRLSYPVIRTTSKKTLRLRRVLWTYGSCHWSQIRTSNKIFTHGPRKGMKQSLLSQSNPKQASWSESPQRLSWLRTLQN